MQKKEPEIIANNNTMEEIYQWMEANLKARKMLDTLKNSVAYLNKIDPKTGEEGHEQENDVSKYDPLMEIEKKRIELISSLYYQEER
ncbi:hypothetical protein [Arsenophonus nasoniae]|uniref:Uncharacterized protein n=1 Tax=Arsenophonus nasoniae TaxID=638 RepID=A0AA95GQ33_9GAMM|nr:hypothetical protein [Arsenophonus nasoniae]WGM00900.1 hypothetical protein QE210_13740 [Arsenophonus nasoniae]